jgi:uncharacterized repeat protein (TIGR01451 family)
MTRQYRARWLAFLVGLVTCSLVLEMLTIPPALAQGSCTPTFAQPTGSPLSVGTAPNAIASVDMNGDGKADLAVVNGSSGTVSIFLGDNAGGFTQAPESPISVGGSPSSIVVGNFNTDPFADLAVGVPGPNTVAILLGRGNGTFSTEAGSVPVEDAPGGIAVGNFNADGSADLAVTGLFNHGLRILLGNNSGGFFTAAGSPINVADQPKFIVAGAFNTDGLSDLAFVNGGTANAVTVMLGTGNGAFSPAPGSPISVGTDPSALAIGDFNRDNQFDLAVTNAGSNSVSILLGSGNGGFTPAAGSPIGGIQSPRGIVVGAFNGDTFDDLAVTSAGSNTVVILNGDGAGGFTAAAQGPIAVGQQPIALVGASLNGDGTTDLAVVNQVSNNVTVLLASCSSADLAVSVADSPDPVKNGGDLAYTITVQNTGPDSATNATLSVPIPTGATFLQMTQLPGWTCTTPAVGQGGTVSCTIASLPVGSATFAVVVRLGSDFQVSSALQTTLTISAATQDPVTTNNSATASTTIAPDPVACATRPRVNITVDRSGTARLVVAINSTNSATVPNNRLNQLNLTIPGNARVDVVGGQSDLTGQQTVTLANGTSQASFFIRRVGTGPITVPIDVVDQCGTWKTLAGGGATAF